MRGYSESYRSIAGLCISSWPTLERLLIVVLYNRLTLLVTFRTHKKTLLLRRPRKGLPVVVGLLDKTPVRQLRVLACCFLSHASMRRFAWTLRATAVSLDRGLYVWLSRENSKMKLNRCCFTLLALFAVFSIMASDASAQDLPANWQQLPAADFANEVDKFFDEQDKRPAGNFDSNAVMKHAASLFLEIDLEQAATTEFPVILKLFRAGWHKLGQKQRAAVRTVLAARQDDWNGRPYEELRSKVIVMEWIGVPYEVYSQDARSWVNAGGDVSTVRDEDLHFFALFTAADPKVCRSSFTVQWEGRLTAPQTGQYTFSISPINVNATYGNCSVEQTMNVSLSGQQIISATPENWNSESQPVQLTAGQIIPIQVNMAVVSPRLPLHALHATLSWKAPASVRISCRMNSYNFPAVTITDCGRLTLGRKAACQSLSPKSTTPSTSLGHPAR